jgi:DNA-binding CsgD family transcriptional regulator
MSKLSPRQREIARLIAEGIGPEEIAVRLGIQEQSVKNQVRRIFRKKGVRTCLQLCALIWKLRLEKRSTQVPTSGFSA